MSLQDIMPDLVHYRCEQQYSELLRVIKASQRTIIN